MDLTYGLFETELGHCAVVTTSAGLYALQLPAGTEERARAKVRASFPDAVEAKPRGLAKVVATRASKLLAGRPASFDDVPLDLSGVPAFHRKVYDLARAIPPGATRSYGELATQAGSKGASRAVGQAMAKNRFGLVVPCHRVLSSRRELTGFSAEGGVETKRKILAREGVSLEPCTGDDVDGMACLARADRALGREIARIGPHGRTLGGTHGLFVSLARAIVFQQLSGKAAATIFGRLEAAMPRRKGGFTHDDLDALDDATIRSAGISEPKLRALRDLARVSREGGVPTAAAAKRMTDDALVERLTRIRGIGRWTVQMLLLFRLARPDVLPCEDLGIRKGLARLDGRDELPSPADVEARGERWRPYRSLASLYLWHLAGEAAQP